MTWVLSFSILSCFGPRRGRRGVSERQRSRRWRLHETAPPRRRRRDPTRVYVVIRTPSTRCHIGPSRATAMLRAGRQPRVRSYSVRHVLRDGLLHHPVHVLRDGVGGPGTDPRLVKLGHDRRAIPSTVLREHHYELKPDLTLDSHAGGHRGGKC